MSCIAPFCPVTSARQHFWVPPRSGCPALRVGAGASVNVAKYWCVRAYCSVAERLHALTETRPHGTAALQAQVQAKGDAVKALKVRQQHGLALCR